MQGIKLTADNPYLSQPDGVYRLLMRHKFFSVMIILSLLVHISLLVRFSGSHQQAEHMTMGHSLTVTLTTPPARQIPPPEPAVKAAPIKKPVIAKVVETPVAPISAVPPVEQVEEKSQRPVEDNQEVDALTEETQAQASPEVLQQASVDPALLAREKEAYFHTLAQHINEYKYYPRSARRRHIEGQVHVTFTLKPDGHIYNLHTSSGPHILQRAAMESIHKATPMPRPPENLMVMNSLQIEYDMKFTLR